VRSTNFAAKFTLSSPNKRQFVRPADDSRRAGHLPATANSRKKEFRA
jgi:hypothetical protein